jgi:dTDP-4-amino-4,6-dideoxygalactose transaminase
MRRVPYVDLAAQNTALEEELLEAVRVVLRHGSFILGPEVAEFESAIAARLGLGHVVAVASGTDALTLALRLHGIGEGDEVVVPSHTFVATASAVRLVGATPVFADIERDTMLVSACTVEAKLSPKTRAVIVVHLGGMPCPMDELRLLCEDRGVNLIEDSAQALGSTYRGASVGSFGTGAFSLHPLKTLSACGDAGFLSVFEAEQVHALAKMRNLGLRDRDHCDEVSGHSRLDTIQAALLLVKLRQFDNYISRRKDHAQAYERSLHPALVRPGRPDGADPVHTVYAVRHPKRDALIQHARESGFDLKIHYPVPVHRQPALAGSGPVSLPVTEEIVKQVVSLPVSPELDPSDRDRLVEVVNAWADRN